MENKCILNMINEINSLANKMTKSELSRRGIPVLINHVPLFYILPEDGSSMEFRHLREAWHISKSSLSDILMKYEELGYVKKDATCSDKRCVYIHLTKEALILKKEFLDIEAKVLSIMVSGYSDQERVRLEQDIVNILNNMKKFH